MLRARLYYERQHASAPFWRAATYEREREMMAIGKIRCLYVTSHVVNFASAPMIPSSSLTPCYLHAVFHAMILVRVYMRDMLLGAIDAYAMRAERDDA